MSSVSKFKQHQTGAYPERGGRGGEGMQRDQLDDGDVGRKLVGGGSQGNSCGCVWVVGVGNGVNVVV